MVIDSVMVIMLLSICNAGANRYAIAALALILLVELVFFSANLLKFADGGWLPVSAAIVVFLLMSTWQEGRRTLNWLVARDQPPMRDFLAMIAKDNPTTVPGTAVYLASEASGIPRALMQNLRFNHILHERNILLTFVSSEIPWVPSEERVDVENLGPGLQRVVTRFGFMETPTVLGAMRAADEKGVSFRPEETIYIVGRENPVLVGGTGLPLWRKRLFALMGRNSQLASAHYDVPPHKMMEISSSVRF